HTGADRIDDGRERGADAAAPAGASDRGCNGGLYATPRLPRPLVLPAAICGAGEPDELRSSATRSHAVGVHLGARCTDGSVAPAARCRGRAGTRTVEAVSDTVVFIPAWNEEENLPGVLDDLRRELPEVDVLVVDDGSTDRTAEIASLHGAEVLSLGTNRGLPIGIAAGYRWALDRGYAYCGRVDADGQ